MFINPQCPRFRIRPSMGTGEAVGTLNVFNGVRGVKRGEEVGSVGSNLRGWGRGGDAGLRRSRAKRAEDLGRGRRKTVCAPTPGRPGKSTSLDHLWRAGPIKRGGPAARVRVRVPPLRPLVLPTVNRTRA